MTKTSPAKPKPKPRQSLIELPEDSGAIFQAVGILPGDVAFSEQGFFYQSNKTLYPCRDNPRRFNLYLNFVKCPVLLEARRGKDFSKNHDSDC